MHFLGVYLCHLGATWESLELSVPCLFVRHMSGGEEPHRSWTHPYLAEAPLSPGVRVPLSGASLSDPGTRFSHNTSSSPRSSLSSGWLPHIWFCFSAAPSNLSFSEPPLPPLSASLLSHSLSLALSPVLLSGAPRNPHHLILAYNAQANKIKRLHANTTHD